MVESCRKIKLSATESRLRVCQLLCPGLDVLKAYVAEVNNGGKEQWESLEIRAVQLRTHTPVEKSDDVHIKGYWLQNIANGVDVNRTKHLKAELVQLEDKS
jgi:hypothetical protein